MKDIAILLPCWKSIELLKVCIPSLLKSITTNSDIIVILNEADQPSIDYLDKNNIIHINYKENLGPSAVDLAIPLIQYKYKYVANVNSDMLFHKGWDKTVINILETYKPCSVSCTLIEPAGLGAHLIKDASLGNFLSDGINKSFCNNVSNNKYKCDIITSYNHPIICMMNDYIKVNGYSDNMESIWIDLKGRGLDDDFAYRLYKLHSNFKFIRTNKAFVYHGISLNSKKLKNIVNGHNAFINKNKISIQTLRKMLNTNNKLEI